MELRLAVTDVSDAELVVALDGVGLTVADVERL